jgi:nucleotide-binding universal stress UspA family protein
MAFKRILVPIDDGDPADWAIEAASSLAHKLHARLSQVGTCPMRPTRARRTLH